MRKEGKIFLICLLFGIITLGYINIVYAQEFSSNNVSTWTAENWKKVAEMDYKERDSIWAKATPEQIEEIIKKLGPFEIKESGGYGGYFKTKENVPVLEKVVGFDNPKLGWWPQGTTGKKIIGDGETFLDLENLPAGVNGLEYKDGQFILSFKDGGKLVIEKGVTDKNGKIKKFPYKDIEYSKGLNDLDIKFSTKDGEVVFSESGFEIKGEGTIVKIGDLSFERKVGETIPKSIVTIGDGRYTLIGVEFKKDNFVAARATSYEFVVGLGKTDRLAKIVSFKDIDGNWVFLKMDNQGRVDAISKPGFYEDKWVPIGLTTEQDSPLKKIYDVSGETVQHIITAAKKYLASEETTIGYDYITKAFYNDQRLKKYASEVTVEGYPDNFLNINGLSLDVGGTGRIDVLRELTGVTAYNTNDYYVKSGDINLKFDKNGVNYPTGAVTNAFKIDDISVFRDGELMGENYALIGKPDGSKMVSKSLYFTAGRETMVTDTGITADVHIDVLKEHLDYVRARLEETGNTEFVKDNFVDAMLDSEFAVKVDLYVPASAIAQASTIAGITWVDPSKGVSLTAQQIDFLANQFMPQLRNQLLSRSFDIEGQTMQVDPQTIAVVEDLVRTTLKSAGDIKISPADYNSGRFTVGFQNNPEGKPPSLIVGIPGQQPRIVPLTDTVGGTKTATFARDTLQAVLRNPNPEKGKISTYSAYYFYNPPESNQYWPSDYLRRLWYNNLGRGSDQWDKMMGPEDKQFFQSEEGFLNKYLKKK